MEHVCTATLAPNLVARRVSILGLVVAALLACLAVNDVGLSAAESADTTTSTTVAPAPLFALAAFPVQGKCTFSDSYGVTRSGGRTHEGVDIMATTGKYVYAVANGTLTRQYRDAAGSLSGNGWRLTTADGTYFFYAHLSEHAPGLAVGSVVTPGQIIGYVGATGNAGSPHLHFEIHPNGGAPINPTASLRAVDGCAITTPPTAPTGPTSPPNAVPNSDRPPVAGEPMSRSTGHGAFAVAVRIPAVALPAEPPPPAGPTVPTVPTAQVPPAPVDARLSTRWKFIEPVVVLSSSGATALAANSTRQVPLTGVAGLGSVSTAVMVRISATAAAEGRMVVHPCSGPVPDATSLTVAPGAMAISTAMVTVTANTICVTSSVAANVKLTVTAQSSPEGAGSSPRISLRALDTQATSSRLAPNQKVTVSAAAFGGDHQAAGLTATFTLTNPAAAGTLSISACGGTELKAPFTNSAISSFSLVVAAGTAGLCVSSTVATDLAVDVTGVWGSQAPPVTPVGPISVLGTVAAPAAVGDAPVAVVLPVLQPLGSAPAVVTSAILNATLVATKGPVSLFVWPCAQPRPATPVGTVPATKSATFVLAATITDGQFCVAASDTTAVVIDVSGVG